MRDMIKDDCLEISLFDMRVGDHITNIASIEVKTTILMDLVQAAIKKRVIKYLRQGVCEHSSESQSGMLYQVACAHSGMPLCFLSGSDKSSAFNNKSMHIEEYNEALHTKLTAFMRVINNTQAVDGQLTDYIENMDANRERTEVLIGSIILPDKAVIKLVQRFRPIDNDLKERAVKFIKESKTIVINQEVQ